MERLSDIKAVAFDVGHTLVSYNNPLDWQSLYSSAIEQVLKECGVNVINNINVIDKAKEILLKYNTRVNPREYEVSSDIIFSELLNELNIDLNKIYTAKKAFYGYFQNNAVCYADSEYVLKTLKKHGIKTGVLTDVAYGMDNEFSLSDLSEVIPYIDICLTSVDVGFRKPYKRGYELLLEYFGFESGQVAFIGDEEKDITGANAMEMISVLINRDNNEKNTRKNYSQNYTIGTLSEILDLFSI